MTNKELMYVEDALGHEEFMQKCCQVASGELQDGSLGSYMKELQEKHSQLFQKFLNLL